MTVARHPPILALPLTVSSPYIALSCHPHQAGWGRSPFPPYALPPSLPLALALPTPPPIPFPAALVAQVGAGGVIFTRGGLSCTLSSPPLQPSLPSPFSRPLANAFSSLRREGPPGEAERAGPERLVMRHAATAERNGTDGLCRWGRKLRELTAGGAGLPQSSTRIAAVPRAIGRSSSAATSACLRSQR